MNQTTSYQRGESQHYKDNRLQDCPPNGFNEGKKLHHQIKDDK